MEYDCVNEDAAMEPRSGSPMAVSDVSGGGIETTEDNTTILEEAVSGLTICCFVPAPP